MGLFSKIFGNEGSDMNLEQMLKSVTDAAGKVAEEAKNAAEKAGIDISNLAGAAQARPAGQVIPNSGSQPAQCEAPYGVSWGEEMPDEENQFNYPGTYVQYFAHVFREDIPGYRIEYEICQDRAAAIFTFWKDERKALVVELLSQSSAAQKLRRDCAKAGIPYLRYYYDHAGWWNTRKYVANRTKAALGI